MQEDSQENKENENTKTEEISHVYFEVGNDLTSKPNALADLIQTAEYPHVQVFCNSPSEADFVDVILRKRNINCGKLIGHVPYTKIAQTLHQLNTGAINVVIVTDISANEVDPGQFDININYSIHEDPEIYLHRCTPHNHESKLRKVYSLVGPLDFGNFHYLKKVVDFEFSKATLPRKEDVSKGEALKLFATAAENPYGKETNIQNLVQLIKEHQNCDAIIGYLLHNTMVVLPELTSKNRQESSEEPSRRRSSYNEERNGYESRRRSSYQESRFESAYETEETRREEYVPPKRDARFYLGNGLNDGLTDRILRDVLEQDLALSPEQVKRLSIRDNYAFVDFDEECAEEIITKLQAIDFPKIGKLFIQKATVINAPRQKDTDEIESESDDNQCATCNENEDTNWSREENERYSDEDDD